MSSVVFHSSGAAQPDSGPGGATASAPIFIGGAPRSGTTLLRMMLDSHPAICCGPELRAIPAIASLSEQIRASSGEGLRAAYGLDDRARDNVFVRMILRLLEPLRLRSGKPRIAEKTPANILHFEELRRLFADSPQIAIVRDGRDVIASLMQMDWRDASERPLAITSEPAAAARLWAASIEAGAKTCEESERLMLRYEDLVVAPRETLAELCAFLNEDFDPAMLRFHENANAHAGENESSAARVAQPLDRNSVGRWRDELDARTLDIVTPLIAPGMAALGYAL